MLLICPLAPSSSVSLIQRNNTGNPRAGKNGRVTGWMGTISYDHSFKAADKKTNVSSTEASE